MLDKLSSEDFRKLEEDEKEWIKQSQETLAHIHEQRDFSDNPSLDDEQDAGEKEHQKDIIMEYYPGGIDLFDEKIEDLKYQIESLTAEES